MSTWDLAFHVETVISFTVCDIHMSGNSGFRRSKTMLAVVEHQLRGNGWSRTKLQSLYGVILLLL